MKAIKTSAGIYKITNKINGDCYIGQASDLYKRKSGHFYSLKRNIHENSHLQNAVNKYGIGSFIFKIILICEKKELTRYEQGLVDTCKPRYNIQKKCVVSGLGTKRTEQAKQKMSLLKKGKPLSEEHKNNLNKSRQVYLKEHRGEKHFMFGRKLSEETRRKLSERRKGRSTWNKGLEKERQPNYGKKMTKETRQKISESMLGEKHYLFGKHIPEKTLIKMSEAQTGERNHMFGKHPSVETRKKMSDARKGDKHPLYGKPRSEETRRKISGTKRRIRNESNPDGCNYNQCSQ